MYATACQRTSKFRYTRKNYFDPKWEKLSKSSRWCSISTLIIRSRKRPCTVKHNYVTTPIECCLFDWAQSTIQKKTGARFVKLEEWRRRIKFEKLKLIKLQRNGYASRWNPWLTRRIKARNSQHRFRLLQTVACRSDCIGFQSKSIAFFPPGAARLSSRGGALDNQRSRFNCRFRAV